jgi:neural Wiskott-Aldrich syndrome protein
VLGKDDVQVEDMLRPSNNDVVEAENHWFRLLDADSGKPVWMFRFHTGFSYQLDRPFFHVFQGRVSPAFVHLAFVFKQFLKSRKFGFLFEDDDEAGAFASKVTNQTCPPRMSFQSFFHKPRTEPRPRSGKHRTLSLSRSISTLNQGTRRAISPAMISAPNVHSFVHVAHAGVHNDGAIETSKGVHPSWKAALGGLQDGRTNSRMMVTDGHPDFVEGFWKSVGRSNSSESTRVDTARNDSKCRRNSVNSLT